MFNLNQKYKSPPCAGFYILRSMFKINASFKTY